MNIRYPIYEGVYRILTDDFPRNLQGPTLQVATGGSATFAPELG